MQYTTFFGYFKKTQREVTPSEFSTLSIITIKGKIRNGVSVLLVGSITIPEDEALLIYKQNNLMEKRIGKKTRQPVGADY